MLWNRLTLCTGGKTFVGARLRRLRGEHGLTQVALARTLGLSTSYVNLLENDQRPVTVAVLLALAERFDLPTHYFTPESDARLVSDLREILADGPATIGQIEELVARMPEDARYRVRVDPVRRRDGRAVRRHLRRHRHPGSAISRRATWRCCWPAGCSSGSTWCRS
jgi:transcriptional regulator with XRE-family HTH domain